MRVFRNPGHTISSFLAPIPQKPNNTDWRRNELKRLKTLTNKEKKKQKLVTFYIFPHSKHQAQLEQHQCHIRLDEKLPYYGPHRNL